MKCRSCKSDNVLKILELGDQYLSDFRTDDLKPKKYPLTLMFCKNCKFVQLEEQAPFDEMYTERYGFKSGVNNTIKADLADIVREAKSYVPEDVKNPVVIDIGANDGTLLSNYSSKYYRIGIDPIEKLAKECEQHSNVVINDFWNLDKIKWALDGRKADIITAISMFYDVADPDEFVREVASVMAPTGVWTIQQNYLLATLQQRAFDNICHEHIGYHSLLSMEHLLERHGLEVVDVSTSDINGGCIRTVVQFKGVTTPTPAVKQQRDKELRYGLNTRFPYGEFAIDISRTARELREMLVDIKNKGQKVFIYGASTRGGTIWQYAKIDNSLVQYAVERNPAKVGKMIASIGVPIISEEQARKLKPEYMLVSIWFFKEEILEREKEYLEQGGALIFPLPKLEVRQKIKIEYL